MDINFRLSELADRLRRPKLPVAELEWGGADVVITREEPVLNPDGFYPDPRFVVTEHALELSWLFEQLYAVFRDSKMIDYCTKYEFIGRLANAALRCLDGQPDADAKSLYWAVLVEANAMRFEMDNGKFGYLLVADGGTIYDDLRPALA